MKVALLTTAPSVARPKESPARLALPPWPPAPPAADTLLPATISRALAGSGYTALQSVSVSVHEGAIVLRGTVPSYFMKQMAHEIVKSACDVKSMMNRLTVESLKTGAE